MTKKDNKQENTKEMMKLQEELDSVKNLASRLENQLKRAVADYHNLEKRINEGRSELTKWGTSELILKILPTLDHLETVVQSGRQVLSEHSESKEWFRGVELAVKEFRNVLQSEGLTEVEAQEEKLFNPSLHEAIDTGEGPQGMILKIVRKGYNLNGKMLRPAQVIVGKYASSEQAGTEEK